MKLWTLTFFTLLSSCKVLKTERTSTGENSSTSNPVSQPLQKARSVGVNLVAAPPVDCPSGGTLIVTFDDANFDGIFDSEEDILSSAKVCNGSNGDDGQDGDAGQNANFEMGSVGKQVANKNYTSCHHDYLYFPNDEDPDQSWLLFRHQANGSSDQGIGNTGFQVWNVDIENFQLASEVQNKIYCTLNWNSQERVLTYTVVDTDDGHEGETGEIRF